MFNKLNNKIALLLAIIFLLTIVFIIAILKNHHKQTLIYNAKSTMVKTLNLVKMDIHDNLQANIQNITKKIINNEEFKHLSTFSDLEGLSYIALYNKKGALINESNLETNSLKKFYIDKKIDYKNYIHEELRFFYSKDKQLCLETSSLIKNINTTLGLVKIAQCHETSPYKKIAEFIGTELTILHENDYNIILDKFNISYQALKSTTHIYKHNKRHQDQKPFMNDNYLSFVHFIPLKNDKKLYFIVSYDKNKIKAKSTYATNIILTVLLGIFFISYILIWFFSKRYIQDPLSKIGNGINNLKQDKFTPIKFNVNNEITQLGNEINHLIEELEISHKNELQSKETLTKNLAFLQSYELAMNESSIVSKADLNGRITFVNENFCIASGYSKDEVIGKPHSIIRHEETPTEIFEELWNTITNKRVWKGILKNQGKDKEYWVDIAILPILDEYENIAEYIAIRHDITDTITQKIRLDNIANTDLLTGFGSRYKLISDVRNSIQPALAILNVDSFSELNDFYGTQKGDIILKMLGKSIEKYADTDVSKIYHLQGDEFVIFSKDCSSSNFTENVILALDKIQKEPFLLDDEEVYLNISCGISFEHKEHILRTADIALKSARREKKDFKVYSHDITINQEYENNIKWSRKIKDALEGHRIVPVFQPIVNNKTGHWEKFESLVRLEDEKGNLITPYHFLEISKKTKHYTEITKMMIEQSFDMFKDKNIEFSINLTIEDILNKDIQTFIFMNLEQYHVGQYVVFEIVESELIEDFEKVSQFIKDVKSYDCKIAIDDFGTGYSNFEYLIRLQADYIKIDGSLIKDIDTNEQSRIVVSTIVNFAKQLDIKTIAEYVENNSILKTIEELEIDYSQGYLFSKPKRDLNI